MVVTIQIRPGKMAGAFRLYSSATGGANDTLSTTFANLDASLSATFSALITKREDTRSAIAGNWGRLSTFAELVSSATLVWPGDTSKVRAAAARQFEISVWQSIANAGC
ncbi:MAG: hypothetical protein AVDCRST_MAG93-3021 [uncultured Chloroflexia bacterium]|uniref:Uncharacterized protein n=1 Tax=uncultured Chloroflexia bacterium TaxID=1672391 RepID=A0A6J4JEG8_9CHLR|nr:MAG: hypothetical protein AVDCRST_MAG93-3021 [uncultured Chloroflexia bacterium]